MFFVTHVRKALVILSLLMLPAAPALAAPAQDNQPPGRGFSTTFSYYYISGSAFTPRDRSSGWSYSGVGCVSLPNGSELFSASLELPQDARIDYLRLYYRDAAANDSTAWITNYDGAGNFTDLISVDSVGAGGYGTTLSPYLGHVVNNASRAYVLNWRASQTGNTMALCGMRVAYRLATQAVYLPLLLRHP